MSGNRVGPVRSANLVSSGSFTTFEVAAPKSEWTLSGAAALGILERVWLRRTESKVRNALACSSLTEALRWVKGLGLSKMVSLVVHGCLN